MALHELLTFTPVEGEFDVAGVEGFLATLPFAFREPNGPWLLCGNAGATHYSRLRLDDPAGGYPYMCLITVAPGEVRIAQLCDEDALAQAREVAEWLHANYRCRISGDEGQDLTSVAAESIGRLYGESSVDQ
jgi:hypothetical protein